MAQVNVDLIRPFKQATGCLPGAYLQMIRIAAARQMLEESATSVQRIGSMVGYNDPAFFRQVFKRHIGLTPTEYRSRLRSMMIRAP
jgi:transcriptional regulator GlxA family with amidase domain